MSIIFYDISYFLNACVGYVRMDFGSGKEFWSTWRGNREDLNNSVFKAELSAVVDQLRTDGLLKDRYSMQKVCADSSNLALDESRRKKICSITQCGRNKVVRDSNKF